MEKQTKIATAVPPLPKSGGNKSISTLLRVPFEPLTLLRPLRLFKSSLGLKVGVAAQPDPDFLVILVEGAGHQARLRAELGPHFKNLKNMVRGSNAPSTKTKKELKSILGLDDAALEQVVHGKKDGPLLPFYLELFQMFEGMYAQMYAKMASGVLTCPNCHGNVLDDMDAWWRKEKLSLQPDAYFFVDRLLKVILGAVSFQHLLSLESRLEIAKVHQLVDPACHPIGQWMELSRVALGLRHQWSLTAIDGFSSEDEGIALDGRMRKWRCGQELLPFGKAKLMIQAAPKGSGLDQALLVARTLALAIDVVQATAVGPEYPDRQAAQDTVARRFDQLLINLRLSVATFTTKDVCATRMSVTGL